MDEAARFFVVSIANNIVLSFSSLSKTAIRDEFKARHVNEKHLLYKWVKLGRLIDRDAIKGDKGIGISKIEQINDNEYVIVYGNLPYNLSTKILTTLITLEKWPPWYDILILMFQKEVAERIIAKSKTKEFGRLSVLSNWRLEIKEHFDVSRNCFYPKPKVDSCILSFLPRPSPVHLARCPFAQLFAAAIP